MCEKDENRLIAENILDLIIRHLQEYCQIILNPSEVCQFYSQYYCPQPDNCGIEQWLLAETIIKNNIFY